jgi:REP element-mobilizing transposase RayT
MPRYPRKLSKSGIYHLMMRGNNRQTVFWDDGDCIKFMQILEHYKKQCGYQIFAYCLMVNHVHLLIKVEDEPLDQIMRRVCGSFVFWYNLKHKRIGNLFQDRFKANLLKTRLTY